MTEDVADDAPLSILQVRVLERMKALGLKAAPLAKRIGKGDSFVRDIIRGKTRFPGGDSFDALADQLETTADYLLGKSDDVRPPTGVRFTAVAVMGEIGAGAEISPDFEQVPAEGIDTVEVPFALPGEMVAFRVKGESMLPRYDEGDVIVVWREQRRATDSFLGEEVAVRTTAGQRYLKQLQRGHRGYNLVSWNARPIEDVRLEWIGEIHVTVRASQVRRMRR